MYTLLALSSFALAAAQGLSPNEPLCPFPIIIQPLVFIQKAPVYVSAQICEVTTLTVGGRTIPVTQVPTLLETRFVSTSTITQSSTCSWNSGATATNANDFHSSVGDFVTLTAPCSEPVTSTLVIPPVNNQPGTKVILVPITTSAAPFTGPCDTLTQTWTRTFCTTITIPANNGERGTVLVIQSPTQNAPAPIQPLITAAKSSSGATPSPEASNPANSDVGTAPSGSPGASSVSGTSGTPNLSTPSQSKTSPSDTNPTTSGQLSSKTLPSDTNPSNPASTGDITSRTSPSDTNPTTSGQLSSKTLPSDTNPSNPASTGDITSRTSPSDTNPTTSGQLSSKTLPSDTNPSNPANTGDITSRTSPSDTNPTTSGQLSSKTLPSDTNPSNPTSTGDIKSRTSPSDTNPTTTGDVTSQTSPIETSSGASHGTEPPTSGPSGSPTMPTSTLVRNTSSTPSTSLCIVTATAVAECCMDELPDGCKALRTTNGRALQPVISACEQAIGNYTTDDMRACWAGQVTDDSRGTNIAECLMDELEDCCITQLPAACSSLRGATGAAVLTGASQCRKALGLFVHGTAKPCLDEKNITAETHGISIVECLEAAYGFRSGPVTISDAQICPIKTVT